MTRWTVALAAPAVLAAAACAQDNDPVPTRGEREVAFPVGIESQVEAAASAFPAEAVAEFAKVPIPVLAPSGMNEEERAFFAETFRARPDGFFAVIQGPTFDVIINGTKRFSVSPELVKRIDRDGFFYLYETAFSGANISFTRFGADYLLEFECRSVASIEQTCLTEEDAVGLADSLIVVGGTPQ